MKKRRCLGPKNQRAVCRGCDSVGRAVASDTRGPRFESSHGQNFIHEFIINCIEKTKIRPGMAHLKNQSDLNNGLPLYVRLNFQPPRPHRGWQSYDAVDWAPVCPQPVRFVGATKNAPLMDEDCLYLNVYTPTVTFNYVQLCLPYWAPFY